MCECACVLCFSSAKKVILKNQVSAHLPSQKYGCNINYAWESFVSVKPLKRNTHTHTHTHFMEKDSFMFFPVFLSARILPALLLPVCQQIILHITEISTTFRATRSGIYKTLCFWVVLQCWYMIIHVCHCGLNPSTNPSIHKVGT